MRWSVCGYSSDHDILSLSDEVEESRVNDLLKRGSLTTCLRTHDIIDLQRRLIVTPADETIGETLVKRFQKAGIDKASDSDTSLRKDTSSNGEEAFFGFPHCCTGKSRNLSKMPGYCGRQLQRRAGDTIWTKCTAICETTSSGGPKVFARRIPMGKLSLFGQVVADINCNELQIHLGRISAHRERDELLVFVQFRRRSKTGRLRRITVQNKSVTIWRSGTPLVATGADLT
jgi:hypothetical protein